MDILYMYLCKVNKSHDDDDDDDDDDAANYRGKFALYGLLLFIAVFAPCCSFIVLKITTGRS